MDSSVRIIGSDEGEYLGVAGDNYRVVIDGAKTGNSFSVFDMTIPPGGGPTPHSHAAIQEWFYLIEGELEYKTEAGKATVRKSGFVYVPEGGAIHCFKNVSSEMARVLCVVMPAGLENFFREFGVPVKAGEFPPLPVLTPQEMDRLGALNEKYGQKTYPPDYLD